jgi:hypothetical protein
MGVQHAERARDTLLEEKLGRSALILTAAGLRVTQSADIIANGFQANHILTQIIVGSPVFNHQGAAPRKEVDLDELVIAELEAAEHSLETTWESLVIVTNAPLIALAKGLVLPNNSADLDILVPYGSVTPYDPGAWKRMYAPPDAG